MEGSSQYGSTEKVMVSGAELQKKVDHLFRKQGVLLLTDFIDYLSLRLESDYNISHASRVINPDSLKSKETKVSTGFAKALDSVISDIENNGGIEPEYLGFVKNINAHATMNLVFEAKGLLEEIKDYGFKSNEECVKFFAGNSVVRGAVLQECMEGKIDEFPSGFYQEILTMVNTLRKVASDELFINIKGKVPGEWIQKKLDYLLEKQDIFSHEYFNQYVIKRLELEYGIKRGHTSLSPDYLKNHNISKEVLKAVDLITQDVLSYGGIRPKHITYGKRVYSEKVVETKNEILKIIEEHRRKKPLSKTAEDKYFADILKVSSATLSNYGYGHKFTGSIILEKAMKLLNNCFEKELIDTMNLPLEYFADIDEKGNIIKEVKVKTTIKEEKTVPVERFKELLSEMYKNQEIFPYRNFLEYISHKLLKHKIKRGIDTMKPKYLEEIDNVLSNHMSGLELIADDVKVKGGISPWEANLASMVYSKRIVEQMEKTEDIIENRYKRRFKSKALKDEYFGEITSTNKDYILNQRLKSKKDAESTGNSKTFLRLYRSVHDLNLTIKERKRRHIRVSFPEKYFYDIDAEPTNPIEKIQDIIESVKQYINNVHHFELKSTRSFTQFIADNTSLERRVIGGYLKGIKTGAVENDLNVLEEFYKGIESGSIEIDKKYFCSEGEDSPKKVKKDYSLKRKKGLPQFDIGLGYEKGDEFKNSKFGRCRVLKIIHSQMMSVRIQNGEIMKMGMNRKDLVKK